jgi:hypothetical protein
MQNVSSMYGAMRLRRPPVIVLSPVSRIVTFQLSLPEVWRSI